MALAQPVINPDPINPLTTSNYWEKLSDKLPRSKFLDFRQRFIKLHSKYTSGTISDSIYKSRLSNLTTRISNSVSRTPITSVRNRFTPEELEGEEIELLNRGETSVSYGAAEGEALSASEGITIGAGSTAAGTSVTTPLVTVGLGTAIAATAGAAFNKIYKSGIQVPGTNYVGPGNPIDNGPPTSQVDSDARDHDIAYSIGDNIIHHDNVAIQKFGDHLADNIFDVPAVIGYGGLTIKKNVEKHTGQLYPSSK